MGSTAQSLPYAPGDPSRRHPWLQKSIFGIAIAVVACLAIKFAPRIIARSRMLLVERRCLNYAAPADRIVYSTDRAIARHLLKSDKTCQNLASTFDPPVVGSIQPDYQRLVADLPVICSAGPTLFLHERRTPRGQSRLVAVTAQFGLDLRSTSEIQGPFLSAVCFSGISGWHQVPSLSSQSAPVTPSIWSGDSTIYAGQADPMDESHFTIKIVKAGTTLIFDGWLKDDDSVALEERQPTLTNLPRTQP